MADRSVTHPADPLASSTPPSPVVRAVFGAKGRTESPRFVWTCWVISRLAIFLFWAVMKFNLGDTRYYAIKMTALPQAGPSQTMIEYPTPVLWFFEALWALSFHHTYVFAGLFIAVMVILDALFTRGLWRVGGTRRGEAVFFWSVFLFLVGPTAYLRFDLVTAVLCGMALLSLERRHDVRAGILVGAGAAIKLWPALLWPALLTGNRRSRIRTTVAFMVTGLVLAVASLVYAGWDRLLSPLNYQSDRGLQIESLWAVPPMVDRIFARSAYAVTLSIWNAWEISGPMTQTMIAAAKVAQAIGIVFVAICYILWLRRGRLRFVESAAIMMMVVLMMILTNKTFSPQYVMWMGGPAAAGIAMLPHSPLPDDTPAEWNREHGEAVQRLRLVTRVLLVATLLTTLVYPVGYYPLTHDEVGLTVVTLALAARNALLVWLFVLLATWVLDFVRRPPSGRKTLA